MWRRSWASEAGEARLRRGWTALRLGLAPAAVILVVMMARVGLAEEAATLPPAELTPVEEAEVEALALPLPSPHVGDFDVMKERRLIRILVPYSKTLYFIDKGRELGIEHDLGMAFEEWLAEKYGRKPSPIRVAFIPVARDKLLPYLMEGMGDIAAGGLTVTPQRAQLVDFPAPYVTGVKEIVVTGPSAPALATLDDLAGLEIMVRQSSSYHEHLVSLSASFEARGLPALKLRPADEDLEDEDLLEMVNAGLLPLAVVDRYKGTFWVQIFEALTVREDLIVNDGGDLGWAIRKDSPLLAAELVAFTKEHKKGTAFGNTLAKKYLKSTKYVKNPHAEEEMEKFAATVEIFKKYADIYKFDYLMLLAQGYQESTLDQEARSPRGAVGIMQLLPSTASDPAVGIDGIAESADSNVHAGARYLSLLREKYLDDPALTERNRTLLAFAAYNAGPGNLRKFRRLAEKSNLDPDVWFGNVEIAAAKIVGRETVQYVSNIFKYYIAYKLAEERMAERDSSVEDVRTTP